MANRKTKTALDMSIIDGDLYIQETRQFPIEDENFYDELESKSTKSIRVEGISRNFYKISWVGSTMIEEDVVFGFTIRKEKRGQKNHWYAYKRFAGKLFKVYVGGSERITEARLLEIAKKLPSPTSVRSV